LKTKAASQVKIQSSTWATKKKANEQLRVIIIAQDFLQEDGIYYFSDSTAAPVLKQSLKLYLYYSP
jgi:hypothetical protein